MAAEIQAMQAYQNQLMNDMLALNQNQMQSVYGHMRAARTPHEVVTNSVTELLLDRVGEMKGFAISLMADQNVAENCVYYTLQVAQEATRSNPIYHESNKDYRYFLSDEFVAKLMLIVK